MDSLDDLHRDVADKQTRFWELDEQVRASPMEGNALIIDAALLHEWSDALRAVSAASKAYRFRALDEYGYPADHSLRDLDD